MPIRVFLADDHAVVRDGLRLMLEAHGDIEVIGDAPDGQTTLQRVERLKPDVVIMDIAMPGLNGIEAAARIRKNCPGTQVVILSMHATSEYIYRALQADARGYVLKESAGREVVDAVLAVHARRRYLSDRIADTMVADYVASRQEAPDKSPLERLSARERQILQLVVEGGTSAQIADRLALSPKTVDTYRSRLMQKLGTPDLPALIRFAIEHGLTPSS